MKNTLIIIGCSDTKYRANNIQAKKLYNKSRLFNLSYKLAEQKTKNILILSSKYGLIKPEDKINYYNIYLGSYNKYRKNIWAKEVIQKLNKYIKINKIKTIIFYCGQIYYEYLLEGIPKKIEVLIPFNSRKIGEILQQINNELIAIYRKKSIGLL